MRDESIQVRVELEGELLKKTDKIREYYGVERYADLVRLLLTEKYRQISNEEKTSPENESLGQNQSVRQEA